MESIGVEPAPEVPAPPPERPRWTPGSGGPSISDRGLKGFRDVVADGGERSPAPPRQAAKNVRAAAAGVMEPPPASEFERAEPRVEAEPIRPSSRRPTPRDAERALVRPPAPEPGRAARRASRGVRAIRSRRGRRPAASSRRRRRPSSTLPATSPARQRRFPTSTTSSYAPAILDGAAGRSAPPRRAARAAAGKTAREACRQASVENRPEPRPESRDDKRVDRWAEKPPEKKKSRFAALPLRKIVIVVAGGARRAFGGRVPHVEAAVDDHRLVPQLRPTCRGRRKPATTARGRRSPTASAGPRRNPGAEEGTLVAQKVVLYEEDPNDPAGKRYVGSAVWRTESVPPAPGQPPDLAIRADIEIPEQKISARWSLRRNDDKALPASHTVEVMFTLPPDFPHGGITNIPGVLMKQSESTRGVPLAGLAVKVTNNFFLIGLSSVEADRTRNIQLLKERAWFDIPVVYNDGRRAIIAIEKGTPGDRAFARAFEAWGQ